MNFQPRSGLADLAEMAQVQPPERLVRPGACPVWVGIATWPSTLDHSGHGLGPVSCQVLGNQDPSRAIASLSWRQPLLGDLVAEVASVASCGLGPSFSPKTVLTKPSESLKPLLPVTHLPDWRRRRAGSSVPYSSISKPCIDDASPAALLE